MTSTCQDADVVGSCVHHRGSPSQFEDVMKAGHKAGGGHGIDYGLMAVFLVWVALTVALIIMLALNSHARQLPSASKQHLVSLTSCPRAITTIVSVDEATAEAGHPARSLPILDDPSRETWLGERTWPCNEAVDFLVLRGRRECQRRSRR